MSYYHFTRHEFAPGDTVEARISFPFPDAWAWVSTDPYRPAGDDVLLFEVEPLKDDVEPSPYHKGAWRSKTGFRVIAKL
jgi:hypothetical protein